MEQESCMLPCEICEQLFIRYHMCIVMSDVCVRMCGYCHAKYTNYDNADERADISNLIYESGKKYESNR